MARKPSTPASGSLPEAPSSEIVLYQTEDGRSRVQVRLDDETVWLTQAGMAELYQTTPQNITLHIRTIYEDGEAEPGATCKEYLQVQTEGARQMRRQRRSRGLPGQGLPLGRRG